MSESAGTISVAGRRSTSGCVHCGLPLPDVPVRGEHEGENFCCRGCSIAYSILSDAGLGAGYYALRERLGEQGRPVGNLSQNEQFSHFDDAGFEKAHAREIGDGLREAEFYLEGVHCAACVWLVEKLSLRREGIESARLDLSRNRLQVTYHPEARPLGALAGALASIGYVAHPAQGMEEEEAARREKRALLIRIAVAGACGGNIMLFASALYAGEHSGITGNFVQLFTWASFALILPVVFYSARPFFVSAWGGLKAGVLHMDVPIAAGITIAFASSTWNLFRGQGHVWFDTLSMLVFLLLIGRFLLETGKRRAAAASQSLFTLLPVTAFRLDPETGEPRRIPVEAVERGELLFVPPGESIPVDGIVEEGRSHVSEALLTGESKPVLRKAGDLVFAGTSVMDGSLTIRAEETGEGTRLSRISRLVQEAAGRRAPIVQVADRIAGYFVAGVLLVAGATFVYWWLEGSSQALSNAIAVLVVSCPCALGLATPFALSVAMGRGARRGILLKGGEAIERLAGVKRVLLDKTGTLTEGKPRVVESRYPGGATTAEILPLIVNAEMRSTHPVAQALAALGPARVLPVEDFSETPGLGMSARTGGRALLVGNMNWLAANGVIIPEMTLSEANVRAARLAASPVFAAVDGKLAAVFIVADRLRADASEALGKLRHLGLEPEILSGDAPQAVEAVAGAAGIEKWQASAAPEQKESYVSTRAEEGLVAMVGDGLNDAAALAAAGVGIAVHGGSEAAFEAADVATAREGLLPVVEAIALARKAMGRVRLNLAISLLYNVVVGTLAAVGWITPLWAAVLMPVSSLAVIGVSFKS